MTLIKDLIAIPEQVQRGDFVLRLAEGAILVNEEEKLLGRTNALLEQRLATVTRTSPLLSNALLGDRYRPRRKWRD
ncbi:MAG: hypothetical protein HY267_02305 [Deltaproteobacteria bacterium]|nr:hypothetical protein [Deltaproteobacteria bacterium]